MKTGKTLTEIAGELERQAKVKRDFLTPSKKLTMELTGSRMVVDGFGAFGIKPIAHEQIGGRLSIPKTYYDRMLATAPQLLAENVNHWLHSNNEPRMARTLDGEVRALLSRRYRPLENDALAEAVLPSIQAAGCTVVSCELTDRRFYIKAVTDKLSFEVKKGDVVQAGLVVSNSEVGMGGVRVEPLVYRLVCLNGMIANDHALRKYHVGRGFGGDEDGAEELYKDETRQADDTAFFMKVRDIVKGSLQQDVFERVARRMTQAASERMEGDPVKSVEVLQKRMGLSEQERGGVLRHLIEGGDLSRWGMVNAVTRTAQDVESYDRATDLERMGGHVLELQQSDWKNISGAK